VRPPAIKQLLCCAKGRLCGSKEAVAAPLQTDTLVHGNLSTATLTTAMCQPRLQGLAP
jgi:hypothetical protein